MTAKDQIKLINKGFKIIIADNFRLEIKQKSDSHSWKVLEKGFSSKAAVERRMTELLQDQLTVED
ncbi:hypothetical protein [Chryseobacterium sp.]|uniref:hypothetical protein n=1 Tax=Chryseobacterium sp. TaxID=1871047 RepID=UPI002897D2D1|nr:hypothetical protein [Chryseobacterium sp.]